MSIDVLGIVKVIEESLKDKQNVYFTLSVLLPYGFIYWFYPEEFSIYTFIFSFFLFTLLIHFGYDIYLDKKTKIIIKIRDKLGVDFVKERGKISSIQEEALKLMNNLESDKKDFHRLNVLNKKLKNWIITYYKGKNEKAEILSYNMEMLENKIQNLKENKNIHEELKDYKELDYFILFSMCCLYILCFFTKVEIPSSNVKLIFLIFFVILLLIDILYRNIKYFQIWFSIHIFKELCLFALIYLKRINKKYKKTNE